MLLVGRQEGQPACKKMGDGGGGHWLVQMEWRQAGWSVCLPLLIFPRSIQFRSSLLAPAHPNCPGKRAIKWLWWCGGPASAGKILNANLKGASGRPSITRTNSRKLETG